MSMKSDGETKSVPIAFPRLGLTGPGYLISAMRHFLGSSIERKSIHVLPRANLNPQLHTEPK